MAAKEYSYSQGSTVSLKGRLTVLAVLAGATLLIVSIGVLRTDAASLDSRTKQSDRTRLDWSHTSNTLLMGDSRVQVGVDPAQLVEHIPGCDAQNFGFAGVASTHHYYQYANKVLRKAGPRRIIYGITPRSFTHDALASNAFRELLNKLDLQKNSLADTFELDVISTGMLRPWNLKGLKLFKKKHNTKTVSAVHKDGFIAIESAQMRPEKSIPSHTKLFTDHKVLPELQKQFFEQVKQWTDEGIRVYCLRIPITQKLYDLEDLLSGFKQQSFAESVQNAGGVWLDFPMKYESFDGSHLTASAAKQFSRDLAEKVVEYENNYPLGLPRNN